MFPIPPPQISEVEQLLAGRRMEVEALKRAVVTENLESLSLADPQQPGKYLVCFANYKYFLIYIYFLNIYIYFF